MESIPQENANMLSEPESTDSIANESSSKSESEESRYVESGSEVLFVPDKNVIKINC